MKQSPNEQAVPMSRDVVKRLMHESGLIEWFNSEDCEYLSFCNVVHRFAVLVQNYKHKQ
jgi:hypothetical protein